MNCSRRELALLIPALAAASGASAEALGSRLLRFEDLPARSSGPIKIREMLNGETHGGFLLDMHVSELAAGGAPHAPHHHVHEEMLLVVEGLVESTIGGRKATLGPGSAAYVASNEEHGLRNAGTTAAKYFVLALGRDT